MKIKNRFHWLHLLIAWSFVIPGPIALAAGHGTALDTLEQQGPQQTAEYIFRNSPRDNLITVQMFGSVSRPGIYYVPEDTDLMRLLTLAGGVVNTGELDEVVVRKTDGKAWHGIDSRYVEQVNPGTYTVNVDKLLKFTAKLAPLKLSHEDFVYVPLKEPWISNDAAKVITLGGVLLTGVLTFFLIKKNSDK
ncbi:MAG: SLBB domain-containing protein [Bdellovibrionota bacterium]